MPSARAKGAILSTEALLSLLAAASLLMLLPLTSNPRPSEYSRLYEYQALQDVLEVMAKDKGLREASEQWAAGAPGANETLQRKLDPIMAGLGFCLRLEADETSLNSPAGCENSQPRDPVSTFRAIQLRRVNATLWKG